MSEAIRAAIDGASTYITEHPHEARYTDSLATATLGEGLRVVVEGPSGERIETDMPGAVGGIGQSPGPGWLFRAAVAACVASLVGMRAAQLGMAGLACAVAVDSESDDRGILGLDASIQAAPLSIRIGLQLSADGADDAQLAALAGWAVEHCPVADAARRAVPVRTEVNGRPVELS